jgi:hypothetical protein
VIDGKRGARCDGRFTLPIVVGGTGEDTDGSLRIEAEGKEDGVTNLFEDGGGNRTNE